MPSEAQIAKYRRCRRIVERLGGYMLQEEWEIGGRAAVFSGAEVEEILAAVQRDNPDCRIIAHWNGEGCYSLSVGVDFGEGRKDSGLASEMQAQIEAELARLKSVGWAQEDFADALKGLLQPRDGD